MQELDVTKPMRYRDKPNSDLRFCCYLKRNGGKRLVLIETNENGNEFIVTPDACDIINVPEEKHSVEGAVIGSGHIVYKDYGIGKEMIAWFEKEEDAELFKSKNKNTKKFMSEWISVKEKLPDDGLRVWVRAKSTPDTISITMACYFSEAFCKGFPASWCQFDPKTWRNNTFYFPVIAWKPLSEHDREILDAARRYYD